MAVIGFEIKLYFTHTHTHTAVLWPFVWDYPGGLVSEDIILYFNRRGEDNRDKCSDNPSGCHPIWTSIIPSVLRQMPFLPQPSEFILAWDRHQICCIPYLEA